ncbi:NAD(P)/FAD-dependent oxidoreductase [Phaeobacter sp. J2-8]|uniref:NAD(P)/FAD-dependent oxidoreductase n=1 Tax=Phaeobacter sp. J2-8 TaxID=2931394 RepID=UPI001FD11562|nr:NAD(P)/FAD-dependent oxidoreductase [Phaeobacter sp. J2-8]MCJ7874008.1 NAD(P)/FAD-dependent oxidoreductase [Phaeobacter sp. J2-8]
MKYDAIVVGGGFAGLAAATYLGRARRRVLVLDTKRPRNRFAAASHGFLGHDGRAPQAILADAQAQLARYPTVKIREVAAQRASAHDGSFVVDLSGDAPGATPVEARILILAFGIQDKLPDIPGLAQRWGSSVLHCPYCHGFEFSNRRLGVLYRTDMSVHQAQLVAEWGPTTLFLNGNTLSDDHQAALAQRDVRVEPGLVTAVQGPGQALASVQLQDGQAVDIEALFVAPQSTLTSPLADQLGLEMTDSPMGPMIVTDDSQMTSRVGVYAAGDIARAPHSVSWAVADGVTAGTAAHRTLVFAP